jgi:hypothetical protein
VRDFQSSFGLEVTGQVDRETWDALESSVESRAALPAMHAREPSMA